jgi:AbiJ N-terminal domain 4
MERPPFSKRHNYRGPAPDITIREDAPESLRFTMLEAARAVDWGPSSLRDVVCRILRVRPDPGNWSAYPNIWDEVQSLVYDASWFKVYDIIEALYAAMSEADDRNYRMDDARTSTKFAAEMNALMVDEGIGWQLVDGELVTRGAESFEAAVKDASTALEGSGRPTAAGHIHEALQSLSRRPEADLSGAVYHAMGALEAVARDLVGDEKATLGDILKRHSTLLPPPLDRALSQVWGYASNEARHVVEGRTPTREEAELVVGLAATVATYFTKKGSA